MDTYYSEGLGRGYFVFDSQAIQFQVEAPPGQSEGARGLRDVPRRALQNCFDHFPLEPFDGCRQGDVPMTTRRRRRRVVRPADEDRREEIRRDETARAGHRHGPLNLVSELPDVAGPAEGIEQVQGLRAQTHARLAQALAGLAHEK